ncbi:hypothetical protein Salmuc_03030 [Salipiger mucosus DSM 16094]|uniref:Uncharacterized protein n=1 Tax=Salipiger mucosus DSM 16094 TaxID=1123237 RepID=S9QRI6_9RHOB|nr:hypothetical protein Salmuc_03030 [Salipiger mucosus DSM 16094]
MRVHPSRCHLPSSCSRGARGGLHQQRADARSPVALASGGNCLTRGRKAGTGP